MVSFKKKFCLKKRIEESSRIMKKYPERVPVIVEKYTSSDIDDIDKNKYLVPGDLTVGQFIYVIRKRLKLVEEKAIFLFIGNTIPQSSSLMSQIYKEHKDIDGFLYSEYGGEAVFGK
jgi:GABA(A) receptor-associated protein